MPAENFKREVREKIDAYIFSVKLYLAVKAYFENVRLATVYVEKDLSKADGGAKRPDLFLRTQTSSVIIDHKFITSTDEDTLKSHLADMGSYQVEYVFDGTRINPEVLMLCPLKIANEYLNKKITSPVSILGYTLDREVEIERIVGQINEATLSKTFNPKLTIPVPTTALMYKFIREEPPVPYTATVVYPTLWSLRDDYESEEFGVNYDVVLRQMNTLFPNWLAQDVSQLTPGRLNNALKLLTEDGLVRWSSGAKKIYVPVSKGIRITDLLDHLIERYAEQTEESVTVTPTPIRRRTKKRLSTVEDSRLERFMPHP